MHIARVLVLFLYFSVCIEEEEKREKERKRAIPLMHIADCACIRFFFYIDTERYIKLVDIPVNASKREETFKFHIFLHVISARSCIIRYNSTIIDTLSLIIHNTHWTFRYVLRHSICHSPISSLLRPHSTHSFFSC